MASGSRVECVDGHPDIEYRDTDYDGDYDSVNYP
jgi:hypothetical protein